MTILQKTTATPISITVFTKVTTNFKETVRELPPYHLVETTTGILLFVSRGFSHNSRNDRKPRNNDLFSRIGPQNDTFTKIIIDVTASVAETIDEGFPIIVTIVATRTETR